jgi:glutamate--cysteine ligase
LTLTKDDVWNHVHDQLFQLQPSQYAEEFPKWPGTVGLEVEGIPVDLETGRRVKFDDRLRSVLLEYSQKNQYRQTSGFYSAESKEPSKYMSPLLLDEDGNNLSLEPGGQVEVSTRPFPCLIEADSALQKEQGALREFCASKGIGFVFTGIDPENSVKDIELQIAKERYQCMNAHFADISEFGQRMMRQTCTIQVNVDFGTSESTMCRRYAAAQFFSPIMTAMFANSPFVDGKKTEFKSFRGRIWLDADPSRCGFVGGELPQWFAYDRKGWADAYAQKLWDSSVVMFAENSGWFRPKSHTTFGQWVEPVGLGSENNIRPTQKALDLQATLMFPEVRAKGFIELRSMDAQLLRWQSVPGTILTGALYSDEALDALFTLAKSMSSQWAQITGAYLSGLEDPLVADLAKKLFEIGLQGVQQLPECFSSDVSIKRAEQFYELFTSRNLCPADQLIELARKNGAPLNLKNLFELGQES